jgi:BON domain
MAAHDYEDTHDIDDLDDSELRDLVREHLSAHPMLDVGEMTVKVADGAITLSGRVGSDAEMRIAEHVITDTLGIVEFTNELVVDQLARGESPEAVDDRLGDEEQRSAVLLGDAPEPEDDEALYSAGRSPEEDSDTLDYEKTMGEGSSWNPPEGPTPEGDDFGEAR